MSLGRFLLELPKVELHVHLEGAMRPETLLALARSHRAGLPADDVAGLREWFRFRDFDHFVQIYLTCCAVLRRPEDFQRLLRDFAADQERERIRYTEIHFTIGTHWLNGLPIDEILDAMEETIRAEEKSRGIGLRLIPDIVRDVGSRTADPTLEWAIEARRRGIAVALGLTGREAVCPSRPFAAHFEEAARNGLHCVAHAGEHAGPPAVHEVLDHCRAERIGHGVRSIEDDGLIERLRRERTPLEVCPTSNLCLGLAPDLASHPFDRLRRAGLELSVNSDDPALFDTTLSREYERLAEAFGYGPEELVELAIAGVRHSFLAAEEKTALEKEIRAEAERLAERELGRALAADGS
ncbi:MAG TPA: adenosine deaminase [Thermoanaerobaculia bacterium]|nr:adenosine deaminase [Thermoanaerobaculia bacterium]